jgi:hypothetical protein
VTPDAPIFSTNTTDRHDITRILLKVTLNTINQTKSSLLVDRSHTLRLFGFPIFKPYKRNVILEKHGAQ